MQKLRCESCDNERPINSFYIDSRDPAICMPCILHFKAKYRNVPRRITNTESIEEWVAKGNKIKKIPTIKGDK